MHLNTRADEIEIDSDEFGWFMVVDTEDGDRLQIRMNQDLALDLAQKETARIRAWWAEGQAAAREYGVEREIAEISKEAYELNDPKHPDFIDNVTP